MVKVKGQKTMGEKMLTIATNDKTKFFMVKEKGKEEKLSFADMRIGLTVSVNYVLVVDKNIATSVQVGWPPTAPKK